MTRSTTHARGRMLLLGIMVIAAGSSCHSRRLEPLAFQKNTGEREHEVAGRTLPRHLGGPLDQDNDTTFISRKTPDLKADITQLNEQQLLDYLNKLVYDGDPKNGEIETVACVHATLAGDTPCAPGEGARLLIEPEIGAHKWTHGDYASTPHGAIIARIINYEADDRKEATFGFPAHTKVWWLVDLDPATHEPRSRFFRRTYSAQAPFVEQVGGDHPFYDCDHVHKVHHGQAIAKYVSCTQSLTMGGAPDATLASRTEPPAASLFHQVSFSSTVPLPRRPMVMALNATWITCDMGCCSTSR